MKRDFAWIRGYERDLIEKDRPRNELYNSIWRMVNLKWAFKPEDLAKMPNVRTLIDPAPSNAVHNAAIALSNTVPRWDVAPYTSALEEFKRTEKIEHCLGWNFAKMNKRGTGSLLFDKMFSSLMYDMVCTRVDDLEFQFKGIRKLSPFQEYVLSKGRFLGQVFDARTIHTEQSFGTTAALLHVEEMRAWDVYHYWKLYENNDTAEGKQVAEALRKMDEKFSGKNVKQQKDMRFVFYEYIDHEQICKHGHFIGSGSGENSVTREISQESSDNDILFADEENKLGFINWSVRIGGSRIESAPEYQVNPMLAPLHWGNSWETQNILRSIIMSEPIKRMLEEVRELHLTQDGKPLPVNEDGVAAGRPNEGIQKLPPSQLDPNAMSVVQALQMEITQTTGANVLSDVTSAKTTPFATLNAMIQVAMSRLDINRRDGAFSCADDAELMLRWVAATHKPLMSYRRENKNVNFFGQMVSMMEGEQVVITEDDFDLKFMDISVDITPKTPTDFQQQVLTAIQLNKQLKMPLAYLLEKYVGVENVQLLMNQFEDEQFKDAETQAALQNIMLQEQMRAQQQTQNQQGQAPQELPNAGSGVAQAAMGALGGGQGMNPAMNGGVSPQTFAPGMTREMVSGQTQGGEGMMAGG